jgi:hypothetical protein
MTLELRPTGTTFVVVGGTFPAIQVQVVDRHGSPVNITGKVIKLTAKRAITDPDSAKWFDLTATHDVDATGLCTFTFTTAMTGFPPGGWPATVRFWNAGDPQPGPPRDAYDCVYQIDAPVLIAEA